MTVVDTKDIKSIEKWKKILINKANIFLVAGAVLRLVLLPPLRNHTRIAEIRST